MTFNNYLKFVFQNISYHNIKKNKTNDYLLHLVSLSEDYKEVLSLYPRVKYEPLEPIYVILYALVYLESAYTFEEMLDIRKSPILYSYFEFLMLFKEQSDNKNISHLMNIFKQFDLPNLRLDSEKKIDPQKVKSIYQSKGLEAALEYLNLV